MEGERDGWMDKQMERRRLYKRKIVMDKGGWINGGMYGWMRG